MVRRYVLRPVGDHQQGPQARQSTAEGNVADPASPRLPNAGPPAPVTSIRSRAWTRPDETARDGPRRRDPRPFPGAQAGRRRPRPTLRPPSAGQRLPNEPRLHSALPPRQRTPRTSFRPPLRHRRKTRRPSPSTASASSSSSLSTSWSRSMSTLPLNASPHDGHSFGASQPALILGTRPQRRRHSPFLRTRSNTTAESTVSSSVCRLVRRNDVRRPLRAARVLSRPRCWHQLFWLAGVPRESQC